MFHCFFSVPVGFVRILTLGILKLSLMFRSHLKYNNHACLSLSLWSVDVVDGCQEFMPGLLVYVRAQTHVHQVGQLLHGVLLVGQTDRRTHIMDRDPSISDSLWSQTISDSF